MAGCWFPPSGEGSYEETISLIPLFFRSLPPTQGKPTEKSFRMLASERVDGVKKSTANEIYCGGFDSKQRFSKKID